MVRAHGRRAGLANVDRFESETLDTGDLTVGTTGPVTGIAGDSGEYEIIDVGVISPTNVTTSNTTWNNQGNPGARALIDWDRANGTGYDNYRVFVKATLTNDTSSETTELRLVEQGNQILDNTVVGVTDTSDVNVASPLGTPNANGLRAYIPSLQVTGGTGTLYAGAEVVALGQIA